MNNKILASTGTVIGRANGYDYKLIPPLCAQMDADGFELMMLTAWYEDLDGAAKYLRDSGTNFSVTHSDKEIGSLLGEGEDEEAMRRFTLCVRTAVTVGSEKMVLHLWGGMVSDGNFEHNLDFCERMRHEAARAGIELLVENIPCGRDDPLSHWKSILARDSEQKFIFDTRFGSFHEQIYTEAREWFEMPLLDTVHHMHISDFVGPPHDFRKLRPIPQPGDGIIDFDRFFDYALKTYHGTITLESPVLADDGTTDITRLNETLAYLKKAAGR